MRLRYSAGYYNTETFAREGKDVACASHRPAETFMRACRRPTEAACLRVRKCANNCQLFVAGAQRFLRHACTAHFRVIHTRKTLFALRIYTQTLSGVFFVHGNAHTQCCGAGAGRSRYFFGQSWSRSRCKDVKAKTCFLLLFSLFLYEEELEPEPELVNKSTWSRSRSQSWSKVDRLRNTAHTHACLTGG